MEALAISSRVIKLGLIQTIGPTPLCGNVRWFLKRVRIFPPRVARIAINQRTITSTANDPTFDFVKEVVNPGFSYLTNSTPFCIFRGRLLSHWK